jgi:TPR repeat protein
LLGSLYEQGLGAHLDLARAAHWYAQGAQGGDGAATFALAMMTLQGRGVDKDEAAGARPAAGAVQSGAAAAWRG